MTLATQKSEAVNYSVDETTLAFFWRGKKGHVHCTDHLSVSNTRWLTQNSSWVRNLFKNLVGSVSNMAMSSKDKVFWVGYRQDVKSSSTQLDETIYIPSSLCRMYQTFTWEIPTLLAVWEMVTRLSSIINWCTSSLFSCMIAVLGQSRLGSSSGLYIYAIYTTWIQLPTSTHCI